MVIEGVRGSGIEGDIAIDDVTIEEGECKDPPPNSEYAHSTLMKNFYLIHGSFKHTLSLSSFLTKFYSYWGGRPPGLVLEYFLFLNSVNMKDVQSFRTIASFLNLSLS